MSIHGNLSNYMISGRVKVKSNVEYFVEIAAIFEDGSAVKNIDRSFFFFFLPQATPSHLFSLMII